MTNLKQKQALISRMIELLELPESAYEKARKRYENLGDWFSREESTVSKNDPKIFPQGSFRLGTVIRPLDEKKEYDLDLACNLRNGINKDSHTQKDLKNLIGDELESYREARGIKSKREEKRRCWRLEYQDELSFHMDIVPCIPADKMRQNTMLNSLLRVELNEHIARDISETTVSITDNQHGNYRCLCDNWNISNPEGYAKWFEYQMNLHQIEVAITSAQVDKVPLFKRKAPLQQLVQILKRHRDNWSKDNPDSKPISIILTTLAARAYRGEADTFVALENVLKEMEKFLSSPRPKILNPVNPEEDFADRWYEPEGLRLRLRENFSDWLLQAKKDFEHLTSTNDSEFLHQHIEEKFSLCISPSDIIKYLGIVTPPIVAAPKANSIDRQKAPRPWGK